MLYIEAPASSKSEFLLSSALVVANYDLLTEILLRLPLIHCFYSNLYPNAGILSLEIHYSVIEKL